MNHHKISPLALCLILSGSLHAAPALIPGYLTPVTVPGSSGTPQGIAVSKSDPQTIYWCRGGIWKTTDGGSTWNRCGTINNSVHVRVDPADANHVYAICGVGGTSMGFWRSTDGGATWEMPQGFIAAVSDPTINTSDGYEVSPDPSDFNHILVSFHSAWANSTTCGVLETTDGGTSWRKVDAANGTSGPGYGIYFLYDPGLGLGDRNTWLMGCQGAGYWRTSNAGASWTRVLTPNMVHGGNQLYYSRNGALYTGADAGGIHRSIDNGITWQPAESMPASSYYLSVTGDGYFLYTASFNVSGQIYVTPESDGLNWKPYKQPDNTDAILPMGTFEMGLDSVNRIMYFSSPQPSTSGIWAMKLITPAISFSRQAVSPASVVSDVDRDVVISVDIKGTVSQAYVDLGLCGGTSRDALVRTTGNRWERTHTVPAGMAGGLRNLVVTAISSANDTSTISMMFTITDVVDGVLVSEGKTATASSTAQGNTAAGAVDGSMATRWESGGGDPQWIAVDLGSARIINEVVLKWEAAYASSYKIQISDNGTSWSDVYATSAGNGGSDDIFLAPVSARHVRMYGMARGTNYAYSLHEFEVYSFIPTAVERLPRASAMRPRLQLKNDGISIHVAPAAGWTLDLYTLDGTWITATAGVGSREISLAKGLYAHGFAMARLKSGIATVVERMPPRN